MTENHKKIFSIKNLNYSFGDQKVIKNITLSLFNNNYCLLGESGSGKTTLAKILSTLYHDYTGQIIFNGLDYNNLTRKKIKYLREKIRLIFQSPETTLNPRMSIYKILKEPLSIYNKSLSKEERIKRIENILEKVKLGELVNDYRRKKISQLSGGQKRRIAIARAIVVKPEFIIADEPTEGLDISLQGGIIELFRELRIPMLIITHNYSTAAALANKIGIMYKGEIVEEFTDSILSAEHPFTMNMKKSIEQFEFN